MVKHPEWNFAEVSKAISEGWKDVTMEEVERLEDSRRLYHIELFS